MPCLCPSSLSTQSPWPAPSEQRRAGTLPLRAQCPRPACSPLPSIFSDFLGGPHQQCSGLTLIAPSADPFQNHRPVRQAQSGTQLVPDPVLVGSHSQGSSMGWLRPEGAGGEIRGMGALWERAGTAAHRGPSAAAAHQRPSAAAWLPAGRGGGGAGSPLLPKHELQAPGSWDVGSPVCPRRECPSPFCHG